MNTMGDRLSLVQIIVLTAYSLGMAGGQILFKFAAIRSNPNLAWGERIYDLIANGYFAGLSLCGACIRFYVGIGRPDVRRDAHGPPACRHGAYCLWAIFHYDLMPQP